ncbi:DNA internalization-related competence protein ComEC/Rec2 [Motilimonas cestriensis]|uniref:DNA internalization-related competence protein ComEC/Rec2 n=1 Tax=Motilimonas cestriensis TaxID=2742685 RepID=A0ABS8W5C6_9GAMM|nr:DNA internalization-related competence protein ComEC/Rec2 [Motilimonas cestriensis]MCE2593292.1 DNA internalization-related competence protein ComEC/Rec2 [Motilimonas cestriensis]
MRRWYFCFVVGITFGLFLPQLLTLQQCILSVILAALFLAKQKMRALSGFPLALVWFSCIAHWHLNWLPNELNSGAEHTIVVRINSLNSSPMPNFYQADLIAIDDYQPLFAKKVRLSWYRANLVFNAGQIVKFKAKIKPVWGRANVASFNQQSYLFSQHVGYQVSVKSFLGVINDELSWRAQLYEHVRALTQGMSEQGLLLALVFADKTGLDSDLKQQVQEMGLAHLLVISGLHIMLVAGACSGLVYLILSGFSSVFAIPIKLASWAMMSGVVGAFTYAWLAGFSLPTQRALLMFSITAFALLFHRKITSVDTLLLVLFCLLLWDPLAVLSVSLWLSFSAVIGIFLIIKLGQKKAASGRRWLLDLLYFQLLLWLLLMPVQIFYFSGISALSPVYNLVFIPIVSILVLPSCLLLTALLLFAPSFGLWLLPWVDQMLVWLVYALSYLPTAWLELNTQSVNWIIFSLMIGLLLAWGLKVKSSGGFRFAAMILAAICLVVGRSWLIPNKPDWQVVVFDVGQGLSVLMQSQQEYLLFDTGFASSTGFSMAKSVILPYFKANNISELRHFIVSHKDNDHAGGWQDIVANLTITRYWHSQPQSPFQYCQQGQLISLGAFTGRFFTQRGKAVGRSRNNNSCVLHLTNGDFSILIPGDIEARAEAQLIARAGQEIKADVVIAAHHGSKTSSSAAFIDAAAPTWVIYSAGRFNPWGFPHNEVVQRYIKAGSRAANTAKQGMLEIAPQGESWEIKGFRDVISPYWYHSALLPFVPRG